jgi:WD40 repeat protein
MTASKYRETYPELNPAINQLLKFRPFFLNYIRRTMAKPDLVFDARTAGGLGPHRGTVWSVTALGDGRLASASHDKTVRVWDPNTGECLRVLEGHADRVNCVTALGDGRLASASGDKTVRVWTIPTAAHFGGRNYKKRQTRRKKGKKSRKTRGRRRYSGMR